MVFDTKYRQIRLYKRDTKKIRNPRIIIVNLIALYKEIIKSMWNIMIIYFKHKHSF